MLRSIPEVGELDNQETRAVMRLTACHTRLRRPLAGLALSVALIGVLAPAASAATTKSMPGMDGWIRLAHLSPNTPAVDVYLYSFGNPRAKLVLHHVAYGTVAPYMKVAPGEYTVAMRAAGASASAPPVLSSTVRVVADNAYTVAGMGPAKGIRLQVLHDRLRPPTHKTLVRVIQASLRQHLVTVTAGKEMLASKLAPDCVHTIVILDNGSHLKIDDLLDSAGSMSMPMGGVDTGLGGTAPRPGSPAALWLATAGAGGLLALAGGFAVRRVRHRPLHAR